MTVASDVEVVDASTVRPKRARKASTTSPSAPAKAKGLPREEPGATGGVKYVARRQLKIGAKKFRPGDEVPEAASWTRVEAWVRSGYIDEVEV